MRSIPRDQLADGTTRTEGGIWVAHGFNFLRYRATKRTVTLPTGERALIRVDDCGTVTEVEVCRVGAGVVNGRTPSSAPRPSPCGYRSHE